MPNGKEHKRYKMSTHKRRKRLRKSRHKKKQQTSGPGDRPCDSHQGELIVPYGSRTVYTLENHRICVAIQSQRTKRIKQAVMTDLSQTKE